MNDDLENRLRTRLGELARKDLSHVGLDEDLVRVLGLDSLAALRMLAAVEKTFDVGFPDDRLSEYRTLRLIRDVIISQKQEGRPCASA